MSTGIDWVSAHLFYHGDTNALLVDLVAPLTEEMASRGLAQQFFFLRYWDGGPHVRLRVLPNERESVDEIRDHIALRCGEYFRRHSAPDLVSQEEYAASAVRLGRWENIAPVERMYPNNSVEFVPYVPEYHRYGTGASLDAIERHFADSSRIALDLLGAGLSPEKRDTAGFSLTVLTWFLCGVDPVGLSSHHGDTSLGSWLTSLADEQPTAVNLEDSYRRQRDRLGTITEQMRAVADRFPRLPETGSIARWAWSIARTWETMAEKIASSERHDRAWLVLDRCIHLMCNRLGVTTSGEYMLRYLAARAMYDLAQRK